MKAVGRWSVSRIPGLRHASDDALVFLALVGPESSPDRLLQHLSSCNHCALRLGAIERTLDDDRRQSSVESDQVFTAARLDRQRANVLKRIGGSRAAARILPFPAHGPQTAAPRHSTARRYIAAAAVGGLLIGGAAGRLFDPHRQAVQTARAGDARGFASDPTTTLRAATFSDEIFLGEFEAAIGAPRVEPLLALDALTPQPADFVR